MMIYCLGCSELLSSDEEKCTCCGSQEFSEAQACICCNCYVDAEDMDRHGLCGSQGNDCQSDEELVAEYGDPQVSLILELSKELIRK